MHLFERAQNLLSEREPFGMPAFKVGPLELRTPLEPQMILRMLVKSPGSGGFRIPSELGWLGNLILGLNEIQRTLAGKDHPFVYVTVRHGPVISETDDEWHVDGFSMRIPHVPEQNYIWMSHTGTEVLEGPFNLPEDFDGMRHNLHHYFQDHCKGTVNTLEPRTVHGIDPYVVHRRPVLPPTISRTFIRISFVPIEIEDDTCMINPLIPRTKPYNREDIRRSLTRY